MTVVALSSRQDGSGTDGIQDRFVGACGGWPRSKGKALTEKSRRSDSTGRVVFTRDAHMSVQVMERNPQAQTPAGPEQFSQGGYEASLGAHEIDERTNTLTFHVGGALQRNLIGKDLPRAFEFSGMQLICEVDSSG